MRDAEISEIVGVTQNWLLDLSASLRRRELSERSLQCLFGLWICERTLGSTKHDGLRELAALIARQLPPVPVSAVSSFDSKLLLLSAYIIRACGHPAFAIETYARKIARALREQAPTHDQHVGEAIILSHLGLADYPPHPTEPVARPTLLQLLHADAARIRRLHARLCADTGFGTRECRSHPESRQTAFAIKVLLIDALNRYDLEAGAMLLRTGAYLRLPTEGVIEDAQRFLALQQLSDGRFGQYDMHAEALREAGLDARFDLHLPLTLSCIWALVESAIPRFRVFSLSPLALPNAGPAD